MGMNDEAPKRVMSFYEYRRAVHAAEQIIGEHTVRRPGGDYFALVNKHDAVGKSRREIEIVQHHQNADAVRKHAASDMEQEYFLRDVHA